MVSDHRDVLAAAALLFQTCRPPVLGIPNLGGFLMMPLVLNNVDDSIVSNAVTVSRRISSDDEALLDNVMTRVLVTA